MLKPGAGVMLLADIPIYARESSDDTSKAPPISEQIESGKLWAVENGHRVGVCA